MTKAVKITGNLFRRTYSLDFQRFFPCEQPFLPDFVGRSLQAYQEQLPLFADQRVRDYRGRDATQGPYLQEGHANAAQEEEMLFLNGHTIDEQHHFEMRLSSSFESFEGQHHIWHKGINARNADLPAHLNWQSITRAFPLHLAYFRLGLQVFESRRSFMLGFSPTHVESLLIEANSSGIHLSISADSLKKAKQLPLQKAQLLEKTADLIQEFSGENLVAYFTGNNSATLARQD